MSKNENRLGRRQRAALLCALNHGCLIAGTGGDAPWTVVESLRARGLLTKSGTCANVLTDAGRALAEELDR